VGIPLAVQRTFFDAGSMGRYLLGGAPLFLVLSRWCEGSAAREERLVGAFASLQAALVIAFAAWVWTE
jgi:hypothetical protein